MHLTVNDPSAVPALVAALRAGDCFADHAGDERIDVLFPWLARPADARQALLELAFFARTWEATHPGLRIRLAWELGAGS